jgi:hypothetical protein
MSTSNSSSTAIEKDILYTMKTTANIFLNTLKQVKKLKAEIDKDVILEMDNNYFIEKRASYQQFNEIFDESSINDVINIIEPLITDIVNEREQLCQKHEYIEDCVETGLECDMITFYYCKFCGVSRKDK